MKINALAFALAALAGTASARLEVKSKLAGLNDGDEPTSKLRGGNFALVKSKQTGLNDGGDPLHRAAGRHTSFGYLIGNIGNSDSQVLCPGLPEDDYCNCDSDCPGRWSERPEL